MYVLLWGHVHGEYSALTTEEGFRFPGARAVDSSKPPKLSPGNQTWAICKSSTHP